MRWLLGWAATVGLLQAAPGDAIALLKTKCLACHNPKVKQGGLDLSTREALLVGSEHGPVITAGLPAESQLYKVVAHIVEPGMPFKGKKLPDAEIQLFADWIKAGAPYETAAANPDAELVSAAASHWAYRPPVRPAARSIDELLAASRLKKGVTPVAPADRATLLRRLYLDLIGLPPTPAQLAAFLADQRPNAYELVVDQLLDSPQHAERWGRHWLDIWRYSDWYGYRKTSQVRYSARHIWRWRDWTIDSLAQNKPYDRMIQEMLAGDELAPGDPDTVRATGFLVRNWYLFNRNVWLQDAAEYTAASFLGLTLKCARCHTHKYDPLPHTDYYRFRAFFESHEVRTDRVPGQADTLQDGLPRVYDANADAVTYRFIRGNEATPDTSAVMQPGIPRFFGKPELPIERVSLPLAETFPDSRPFVTRDLLAAARAAIEKAAADLKKAHEKPEPAPSLAALAKDLEFRQADLPALEARIRADLATLQTPVPENMEQLAEQARKLELQANAIKADAEMLRARHEFSQNKNAAAAARLEAATKLLKEPAEGYTPIGPKYPASSSGRRLALARWITGKDNPLTARVAINHMWARHFGAPLVPTVFNFGKSGQPPSHPELLDWLAVEFMQRNWDMKAMHRLMVTSQAYRLASTPAPAQQQADPDNRTLWRANVRRMEAEVVRDSALHVAGLLDPARGGPEIDETKGHDVFRRSLYFRTAPDLQMDMLKVFDAASPIECFERSQSIVPQQALALANGKLSFTVSRAIAASLAGLTDPHAFVQAVFARLLGRPAKPGELRESAAYLDDSLPRRESLVHVLLNHNDFVTIR